MLASCDWNRLQEQMQQLETNLLMAQQALRSDDFGSMVSLLTEANNGVKSSRLRVALTQSHRDVPRLCPGRLETIFEVSEPCDGKSARSSCSTRASSAIGSFSQMTHTSSSSTDHDPAEDANQESLKLTDEDLPAFATYLCKSLSITTSASQILGQNLIQQGLARVSPLRGYFVAAK